MSDGRWEGHTTMVPERTLGKSASHRYYLNVVTGGLSATHPLPDEGEVTIGRADTNTIQIHDRSLSRMHATLRIATDGSMTVEDMGSSNGTRVRETPLKPGERASIAVGEVVDLGATLMVVQSRASMTRA